MSKTENIVVEQEDILPEPDGDVVEEVVEQVEAAPVEEVVEAQESSETKDSPDWPPSQSKRDAIYEMFKEQRDLEEGKEEKEQQESVDESQPDTKNEKSEEIEEIVESHEGKNNGKEEIEEEKQAEIDPEPEYELNIYGKKVKKPLSEIISLAQINEAANLRLEETRRLLDEAKTHANPPVTPDSADQLKEHPPETVDDGTPEPDQSQDAQTRAIDPEKIAAIVDRIQVGDKDEGAAALSEFYELVSQNAVQSAPQQENLTEERIREIAMGTLVQQTQEQEYQAALDGFAQNYKGIVDDPDFTDVTLTTVARKMRDSMINDAGLTEEHLAPFGRSPLAIAGAYRQLKQNGYDLPSYSDLLTEAGDYITDKFGIKNPAPEEPAPANTGQNSVPPSIQNNNAPENRAAVQERTVRKQSAQTQPRPTGGRAQVDNRPRPKTPEQIIQEMRASRKFSVQA